MTPDEQFALDVARGLATVGIPVFVAEPDDSSNTGFRLPRNWQQTRPDPAVVDTWAPGKALAVVMGQGLDLLDVDPRSGGDPAALNGSTPVSYGAALTPSGGVHSFIASLGVRSRDNVLPGIDVKAGDPNGAGRGFAFIAPTVRASKVTGELLPYRWGVPPDLVRLNAVRRGELVDDSGAGLRELIASVRSPHPASTSDQAYDGPTFEQMDPDLQQLVTTWVGRALEGIRAELKVSGEWAEGQTDERGRGWEKIQADAALRLGQLARAVWNDLELSDAREIFVASAPTDGTWGLEDVELKWSQQHGRLDPAPWPDLRSASERDAEAWAQLGLNPVAATAGPPPGAPPPMVGPAGGEEPERPPTPDVVASRYFGAGGLQALTLASDVLARGPLMVGRDDILWSYEHGVWKANRHVVRDRLTWFLGQRFRTGHTGTVEAIVRACSPAITCAPVPDLVNFTNGLLHWRTGELRAHTPEVPSTVQLGVDYDRDATCPAFDTFLSQVVPEDVVATIWELIGYLMYSGNPLHKAVMLTGHGRNGKGTFLRVLQRLLGAQNVTNVSLHDLVNTRFSTVDLFGRLANIAGDIDATYMENTATFKQITGGDTISAEHKGRDRFNFTPWAVPLFSANKIPASADTSIGYLSRWLVVPFPHNFTGREDRHLDDRLQRPEELRGIAVKGIAHLEQLLDRGDFMPSLSGEIAREDFIRRVDQVRTWIADCCEMHPEIGWTARSELYESYKRWADRDGHRAVRASEFYDRLEQAGAEPAKVHGTRGFNRIRVIDAGWTISGGMTGFGPVLDPPPAPAPTAAPAQTSETGSAQPVPETPPTAPTDAAHENAGQPQSFCSEGAEGADALHPPSRAYTREGGLGPPAPSAPTLFDDQPEASLAATPAKPERSKTQRREQTAEARDKRAKAAAEKRAAAIAAAAGENVELPALVLRDGSIQHADLDSADALLATLPELTVDIENTGFPVGHRDYALRTVQLGDERFAFVLDPHQPDQADVIRARVAGASVLHAHSATADLVPLEVAGLLENGYEEAWSRMHDTVIPAKLADPASTGSDPGLKKLAAAVLPDAVSPAADEARSELFKTGKWLTETKATTPLERSGWAQVDSTSETMIRYAASDVLDDGAIARVLPQPDPAVLERERLAQRMTARVALRGLRLDGEHVTKLREQQRAALESAAERLGAFGIENPGSDQQVGTAVEQLGLALPRTPTGRPSVAAGVLEPYAEADGALGELICARLAYQEAENRLGLFLEGYHLAVEQGDGRVRPTVYTMEAKTGRMSCVRPNLQQVPRSGGYRACITADPGQLLVSADFSSVELRVAAALSQDPSMIQMLEQGIDYHQMIAQIVWGPAATKAHRYKAKPMVFGRIYGSGAPGLARSNGVSEAVARQVIDAMDHLTPGLTSWSRQVANGVESGRTKFATHSGRIVHMPIDRPYAAPNYCIQGTARELLIDTLVRWAATKWGQATLLPVHDELVVVVPEAEAEAATAELVRCMTTDLLGVPIIAEASEPSYAWSDSA